MMPSPRHSNSHNDRPYPDRAETLNGGSGNDYLEGFGGNDKLIGNAGDDQLFGGDGKDRLYGGDGDDFLLGGSGIDYYSGGAGYDTISFSDTNATQGVIANLDTGTIRNDGYGNAETMMGIEGFSGGTLFADRYSGDDADNSFFLDKGDRAVGLAGDDLFTLGGAASIDGGSGLDTLAFTSETYRKDGHGNVVVVEATRGVVVDLGAHTITDGFGNHATVANIETVFGTGFADSLTGGDQDDVLLGQSGNDLLQGGDGYDTLWGDLGNDRQNGGDGNDWLFGEKGDDKLSGGNGDDVLIGGAGIDTLTGGAGRDIFTFDRGDSTASRSSADIVTDFSQSGHDSIDLSSIAHFRFVGESAFDGKTAEVRFEQVGNYTWIEADTNGDKHVDLSIRIDGHFDLVKADFII